jgi:hypothetical protein
MIEILNADKKLTKILSFEALIQINDLENGVAFECGIFDKYWLHKVTTHLVTLPQPEN